MTTKRPYLHGLIYGEAGSGKSTFFATWPKPMLVFMFDPYDKATPYFDLGECVPFVDEFYQRQGIEVMDVVDPSDGNLLVRVEHYADPDPTNPIAHDRFVNRLGGFEVEVTNWASVGIDSMTYLQYASLQRWKKLNPLDSVKQHSNISWYGGVKEDAATLLMSRACWWKTNVGVICHTSEDKDEFADFGALRGLLLPGKLSKQAPAGFGEIYRVKVVANQKAQGDYTRQIQTRSDNLWIANSLVAKAPNPCEPTYEALWANWEAKRRGGA